MGYEYDFVFDWMVKKPSPQQQVRNAPAAQDDNNDDNQAAAQSNNPAQSMGMNPAQPDPNMPPQ